MHGIVMKITEQCVVVLCEDGKFRNLPHLPDMPKLGDRIPVVAEVESIPVRKHYASRWFRQAWWVAASILLLIGAVFWWNPFTGNASTLVAIDINPSMELYVKQDGRIEKVKPLNDDARKLLSKREYKGQNFYEAVDIILDDAKKQGYLNVDKGKNLIMLSTMNLSSTPFQLNKAKIGTSESGYELKWFEADQSLKDKAEEAELSLNKYIVYEKAKEQGIELEIEELRSHSIVSILNGAGVDPQRLFDGAEDEVIEPESQVNSSEEGSNNKIKDEEQADSESGKEKGTLKKETQKEKEKESQQQGQDTSQDRKQPSNNTVNRGTSSQKQDAGESTKESTKEPAKNGTTDGSKKDSSFKNIDKSEPGKGENRSDEGKKAKNNVSGEDKPGKTNPDKNREESGHKAQ